MKNKYLNYPLLTIVLFLNQSFVFAQQVKPAKPGIKGSWQELGFTVVDFKIDKDVIRVTGADNFRQLKFKVFDSPVNILNMNVVYENGGIDNIELRSVIRAGGESRILDLKGDSRRIRKVEFWYKSEKPGFRGKAKIVLWGIK